jgi:hypothetical protein
MPAQVLSAADPGWRAATVSPLLLELARALRARRHYAGADPVFEEIVDRAAAIWAATLGRSPELCLTVQADGFALASGERVLGSPIAQLASELGTAGIEQLEFRPGLRPEELVPFIEILARATRPAAARPDYAVAFEQAGIKNISLAHAAPLAHEVGAAAVKPEPAAAAPAARERGRKETEHDRVGACLAELDRSTDAVEYQRGLEKLRARVEPLMRSGDYVDAYAAALMLGRHTGRRTRSTAICEAASEALQSLVLSDAALTRLALERVYSQNSSHAIEALQLLASLGPRLVPHLFAAHERGGADARQCTAAILLAMGDPVFPALIEQLESPTQARAILAAELLGEMQNPRALPALSGALAGRGARGGSRGRRAGLCRAGVSRRIVRGGRRKSLPRGPRAVEDPAALSRNTKALRALPAQPRRAPSSAGVARAACGVARVVRRGADDPLLDSPGRADFGVGLR